MRHLKPDVQLSKSSNIKKVPEQEHKEGYFSFLCPTISLFCTYFTFLYMTIGLVPVYNRTLQFHKFLVGKLFHKLNNSTRIWD